MRTFDMISATPNTVEAIRKAHAIRKDLRPDGSYQYSFPSSKPLAYNGMWKVTLEGIYLTVPAFPGGNLILTEDRLFATVTESMNTYFYSTGVTWCYLHVAVGGVAISLVSKPAPAPEYDTTSYLDDYIPLAIYSPETGLIQLQYGPVRLHRYWLADTGSGSESGGGGEAI